MQQDPAKRPECSFKEKCYRKNPHHFKEYRHEHLSSLVAVYPDLEVDQDTGIGLENLRDQLRVYADIENSFKRRDGAGAEESKKRARTPSPINPNKRVKDSKEVDSSLRTTVDSSRTIGDSSNSAVMDSSKEVQKPMSKIERKLQHAAPFNFFLTKIKDNPATHNDQYSVYMTDLMHPSLGKIKSSLQINFMVDLEWLQMNYEVTNNTTQPLVILYGQENPDLTSTSLPDNIRAVRVKPKYPYGTHHTKMMVFVYDDESVRVVVHTANLIGSDWENRTQGVWVSPRCPKQGNQESTGDSVTNFKSSLIRYLRFYEVSPLKQFLDVISGCDMSAVNVYFVASVPNSHRDADVYKWGHRAVSRILRQHVTEEARRWAVKVQCSSIGSLGQSPDQWLELELGSSLSCCSGPSGALPAPGKIELVYPSHEDVMSSYEGPLGGGCLPYSGRTHAKQPWLTGHMCRWRAEASSRTRAMPHIKSYTRIDPDNNRMAYFMLTSANLSKAAWGSMNKAGNSCMIMSYEAGVLFLPKLITGEDTFQVAQFESRLGGSNEFPLHYDLPVLKYGDEEKPWLYDYLLS